MMPDRRRAPDNDLAGIIAWGAVCAMLWALAALAVWVAK